MKGDDRGAMAEGPDLSGVAVRLRKPAYRYHQFQGSANGCGPTSLAIAVNALAGVEELEGAVMAREMDRIGLAWRAFPYIALSRIPGWATFPWGIVHHLRRRGVRAWWSPFGTVERLKRNLAEDRITMVAVGEPFRWKRGRYQGWAHVKVVYGYEAGRGWLFVDPGVRRTGSPEALEYHGLSWQGEEAFLGQWANVLRVYIEVG